MKIDGWTSETRPCGECRHIKRDLHGHLCQKFLMTVVPDLRVMYSNDMGPCFEEKAGEGER